MVRLETKPPVPPVPDRRGKRLIVPIGMGATVILAVAILIRASLDSDEPGAERSAGPSRSAPSATLPNRAKGGEKRPEIVVVPLPPPAATAPSGIVLDSLAGSGPAAPAGDDSVVSPSVVPGRAPGGSSGGAHAARGTSPAKDAPHGDGAHGRSAAQAREGSAKAPGARRGDQKVALAGDSGRREAVWQRPPSEADTSSKLVTRFAPTGGATLKGRVVDAETGKASAGVAVEAHIGDSFMKTTTDGAGVFRMPGIFPGRRITVWIIGRSDTFVAERLDVTSPGEGETADAGVVRLLHGDELASHLEGWMGMFVSRRGQRTVVAAVSPWSPADRAGIEVGDVLLSIAGRDVDGLGPRATGFLLRGPVGTKVGVAVQDRQGMVQRFQLERVLR